MFKDRNHALQLLETEWQTPGFRLPVIYARCHSGRKTFLDAFAEEKNIPVFKATKPCGENDSNFSRFEKIARQMGVESNAKTFADILGEIIEASVTRRIALVIHDFENLLLHNPMFFSALKRHIDRNRDKANLFLLFSTSSFRAAEQYFASYEAKLLQRKTLYRELPPLTVFEMADLVPTFTHEELCLFYGMAGGMPGFLLSSPDVMENMDSLFLHPKAELFLKGQEILRHDLDTPEPFLPLLSFLSVKPVRKSEITDFMKERNVRPSRTLSLLDKLVSCHIVHRHTPLGENLNREKYFVDEPFLRFYCRFILPATKSILSGISPDIKKVSEQIREKYPQYMKYVFERICRQWLENADLPFIPTHHGPWWKTDKGTKFMERISIVASSDEEDRIFCACSFRDGPIKDSRELHSLQSWSSHVPARRRFYIFFAKDGFSDDCQEYARKNTGFRLLSLADMFAR